MKISCLMATTSRRVHCRPLAITCYEQQVTPPGWQFTLEVDDHESDSLGKKLNRMVARSASDFFVIWDDDDWHSAERVRRQVEPLLAGYEVSGSSAIFYYDTLTLAAWRYHGNVRRWLGGLAFRRDVWERRQFADFSAAVDTNWLGNNCPVELRFDLADPALFIATIHAQNTCPKFPEKHPEKWDHADYLQLKEAMDAFPK